jgi:predicted aspartyl protease
VRARADVLSCGRLTLEIVMRRLSMSAFALMLLLATISRAEVRLRWDSTRHVVVPTMVNGKGPFDFILDTGADETGVFSWLAKQLDLPAAGAGQISGATGSAATVLSRLSTLSVDGHEITNVSAITMPDRPDGAKLGGVVGVDLMTGRFTLLDFGCGTAALLPLSSGHRIAGAHARLVKAGSIKGGKQLTLVAKINGAPGLALLDSGSRTTIINWRFASAAGLDPKLPSFRDGDPARGATQKAVSSRVGPIGTVKFAGITREAVTARVADLPFLQESGLSDEAVMILGLDLLRGTRVTIDYSERRFWIAPSSCPSPKKSAAK